MIPERQHEALLLDEVVRVGQLLQRVIEKCGQFWAPTLGRQRGDLGPVVKPGLEDAAHDREVELTGADEQAGEQAESCLSPEVAHGGGVALTHLDQTSGGEPLERFSLYVGELRLHGLGERVQRVHHLTTLLVNKLNRCQ